MSAIEETQKEFFSSAARSKADASWLTRLLQVLSGARCGVVLLILLAALSMTGMLIMQQSVAGFDKYFAELTPTQKSLYGALGLCDIYHTWYFNAALLILSLNLVMASLERFPKTWRIITRRKLVAGRAWLLSQPQHAQVTVTAESQSLVAARVKRALRRQGCKVFLTEKDGSVFLFGERGAWNRLGYVGVHLALLTIFAGGFLTTQFGRDGQLPLEPGTTTQEMTSVAFHLDGVMKTTVQLPFTITCTDIEQRLINKDGSIAASNTLDWLTRIRLEDETGAHDALVHLNEPYDYRGYRFFQMSAVAFGQARDILLRLTPANGGGEPQLLHIKRGGAASLADGTKIDFVNFQPDFKQSSGGRPNSETGEYNNPAAMLSVTTPQGEQKTVYAFAMELPDGAPVGAPFGGYKYRLVDFEKAPLRHILAVQKDPGKNLFYTGGALLLLTLGAVFLFSHQRVWARIEPDDNGESYRVFLGGSTNRNKLGFQDRFKRIVDDIQLKPSSAKAQRRKEKD